MRWLPYPFLLLFCLFLLATSLSLPATAQNNPSVLNWTELPVNQKVMISQAGFFPQGFAFIDTVGHKILVPFHLETKNLYVLQFAVSPDGTLYLVNRGDFPVLYIPQNGYLVNGLWADVRWYPFTRLFHPAQPVFLSLTPGFPGFMNMSWYPEMSCWGGFWSNAPWNPGQRFPVTPAQEVIIDGTHYTNWRDIRSYWKAHPTDRNFLAYWNSHPTGTPIILRSNPGLGDGPVISAGSPPVESSPIRRRNPRPVASRPVRRRGSGPISAPSSGFSPLSIGLNPVPTGRRYLPSHPILRPRRR